MTARNPLVVISGQIQELPAGDTVNGASGGSSSITQVEVDFGTTPVDSKVFTITDAAVTTASKIIAEVAYDAPTGKDLDEIEMDTILVSPGQAAAGSFQVFVRTTDGSYLADKFKINYVRG